MKWFLGTLSSLAFLMIFMGAQGVAQTALPPTSVNEQSYMSFTLGFGGMGLAFAIGWWGGAKYTAVRMNQELIMRTLGIKGLEETVSSDSPARGKR